MIFSARVGTNGRITIPPAVREALSLRKGDEIVFRLDGQRVTLARTPDLIQLAGSVRVPAPKRDTPWNLVLRESRRKRAANRR